jgi:ribosomal protein L29
MSIMDRRINNVLKAMRDAKDYEMKSIWNRKLQELFEVRGRKAFERLEHEARMVH